MTRTALVTTLTASVIAIVVVATSLASPKGDPMFFKKSEQQVSVNLGDLANVQLGSGFTPIGLGSRVKGDGSGFNPAAFEFHRSERQITFSFEKDQKRNMGGYTEDPILLNITLYNPALSESDLLKITGTTVVRFYPPVDDVSRKTAHFEAQQWLPDVAVGRALTRTAETNNGRGDNLVSSPPARWLVIHVDPVRKVRVDLYAWQKKYSLDEARALVLKVTQAVQVAPKLTAFFENVKSVDQRLASRHMNAVAATIAKLSSCGINSLSVGEKVFAGECAAWLSDDQRYIHVARSLGRVPYPEKKRKISNAPEFAIVPMPPGKPAALIGPPDFQLIMFYWDEKRQKWDIDDPQFSLYGDEERSSPLVAAIAERLSDRNSVHLVSFARYDLQFHADRVAVAEFLAESNRTAVELRAGRLIAGVSAQPTAFGK